MREWKEFLINDLKANTRNAIAMGPFGSRIKAENFVKSGIPVIKGGNLTGDFLVENNFDYLTKEKADELKASNAFRRDIVITHRGTLGQVGIIPDDSKYERYVVSQSQLKVTLDKTRVNPYFIYYFFQSPLGQHRLLLNASQVGVPAIAQASTSVKNIMVSLPESIKIQNKIVDILLSLDNKIALNRKMNETLEGMAQALFKSWFIDFDPVLDNAILAGNPIPDEFAKRAEVRRAILDQSQPSPPAPLPKVEGSSSSPRPLKEGVQHSSSPTGRSGDEGAVGLGKLFEGIPEGFMKRAEKRLGARSSCSEINNVSNKAKENDEAGATSSQFHHLFPDSFELTDELGWIPKGWEVKALGKISKFVTGKVSRESLSLNNYISTENMEQNRGGVTNASSLPSTHTVSIFDKGHVLVSNIRPYFKKIWLATFSGGRSNDVLAFEAIEQITQEFLYSLLYQDQFFAFMMASAKGSKMPRGDKTAIMAWPIVYASKTILDVFSQQVKASFALVYENKKQSEHLASIRDTLLPKLLSGELNIENAEKEMEGKASHTGTAP